MQVVSLSIFVISEAVLLRKIAKCFVANKLRLIASYEL